MWERTDIAANTDFFFPPTPGNKVHVGHTAKLLMWPSRRRDHTAPRGATQLEPQGWLGKATPKQEKKGKNNGAIRDILNASN